MGDEMRNGDRSWLYFLGDDPRPRVFYMVDQADLDSSKQELGIDALNGFLRVANRLNVSTGIPGVGPLTFRDGSQVTNMYAKHTWDELDGLFRSGRLTPCPAGEVAAGVLIDPGKQVAPHPGTTPTQERMTDARRVFNARRFMEDPRVPPALFRMIIDEMEVPDGYVLLSEPLRPWVLLRNLLSIPARLGAIARKRHRRNAVLSNAGFVVIDTGLLPSSMSATEWYAIPIMLNAYNPSSDFRTAVKPIRLSVTSFASLVSVLEDGLAAAEACAWAGCDNVTLRPGSLLPYPFTAMSYSGFDARDLIYLVIEGRGEDQDALAGQLLEAFDRVLYRPRLSLTYDPKAVDEVNVESHDLVTAMWSLVRSHPNHYFLTCRQCHSTVFSKTHGPERQFCSDACRTAFKRAEAKRAARSKRDAS